MMFALIKLSTSIFVFSSLLKLGDTANIPSLTGFSSSAHSFPLLQIPYCRFFVAVTFVIQRRLHELRHILC